MKKYFGSIARDEGIFPKKEFQVISSSSHPLTVTGRTPRRAVFLDRDGTINVEKDYLYRIDDLEFIPGAPEAIRRLRSAGFLIIVVTNQSGVARGYFTCRDVELLHDHLRRELEKLGTTVDAFYFCPHHPQAGLPAFRVDCDCRKGRPGLLLQAADEHDIDLTASFMVGDKRADLEAGLAAGCPSLLVRTGYGRAELDRGAGELAKVVVDDLAAAADYILNADSY